MLAIRRHIFFIICATRTVDICAVRTVETVTESGRTQNRLVACPASVGMGDFGGAVRTGLFTMVVGVGSILLPVLSGVPMPLDPIFLVLLVGILAFSVGFFGRYLLAVEDETPAD